MKHIFLLFFAGVACFFCCVAIAQAIMGFMAYQIPPESTWQNIGNMVFFLMLAGGFALIVWRISKSIQRDNIIYYYR